MIPASGSIIGIDVGCSPTRRSSAICRIDWSESAVEWEIKRFRALDPDRKNVIDPMVAGRRIVAAGFDGPIRRGFDPIGRYRTAERMLTRGLGLLIGKPGQSSTPVGKLLNDNANKCVRYVLDNADLYDAQHGVSIDQKAVVEAFPSSFLGMMIDNPKQVAARRRDRSDKFFRHLASTGLLQALIQHLLPGRRLALDPSSVVNHDDRAALVCAFSALSVAAADFVAVGDDDGWIILPPRPFIRSLQWSLLSANAEKQEILHISSG